MDAGKFDRRIQIQSATFAPDDAGDPVPTWTDAFKRWARYRPRGTSQGEGAGQTLRQLSADFTIRNDRQARTIAPESFRILYDGRLYVINGITESEDGQRHELLVLSASTRPDLRGALARGESSVPNAD